MVYIPSDADRLKLMSTYSFGLADQPNGIFQIPLISEVAIAFSANVTRLKSMMVFPAYLADFSRIVAQLQMQAHYEKFGNLDIDGQLNDGPTARQLFQRFAELFDKRNDEIQQIQSDHARVVAFAHDMVEKGGATTIIISGSPAALNAFESAMMSYITSAWTAFETATSDLWEAALNHCPWGLADLSGARRYKGRPPGRASDSGQKSDKQVRLDDIRNVDWNTRNKMGSILRSKFSFTSLWGIRGAYEAAFYKKSDDIDSIITSEHLDKLSALRNVIVHKSAKADAEYVSRAKDFPALPQIKRGEAIKLDGKLVSDLIFECMIKTFDLISAVDKWLVENTPKHHAGAP